MRLCIILFALFLGVQTIQAQNDSTQSNQAIPSDKAIQTPPPAQSEQPTQSEQATQQPTQSDSATQSPQPAQGDSATIQSGQPTSDATEITDEELEKYAIARDSISNMKEALVAEMSVMIKDNEKIKVARYNELVKIKDNQAALTAAKATPEEIAFLKEVDAKREAGTAKIQEAVKTMAQDYVGATSYVKIKKALSSDPEVQKRYQSVLDKLGVEGDSGGN